MAKKLRKDLLLSSLIIALFIFSLGVFLGYNIDRLRVNDIDKVLVESELDADSLIAEKEFMDTFSDGSCDIYRVRFDSMSERLGDIASTLTRYDTKSVFKSWDYEQLRKKYFILEIQTYALAKRLKEECGLDNVIILFFYDVGDSESLKQGYALDSVVNDVGNVRVFSIDSGVDEPLVETVKVYYNIVESPAVVVDYDYVYEGYISSGELKNMVL